MALDQIHPNAACALSSQLLPQVLRRSLECKQYACGDYIGRLRQSGIVPSMSRAGCPWDNAMAESFMATLKREEVDGRAYRDLTDARGQIGTFLEQVYTRYRLHSHAASHAAVVDAVCA